IARDPTLVLLDLRDAAPKPIPGAIVVKADSVALGVLAEAVPGRSLVVVYDADGRLRQVPGHWPRDLTYRHLAGGRAGWEREVLTPATTASASTEERARVRRQNEIAAFYSGAVAKPIAAPPPPAATGAGPARKKKAGGC
ncbi:MAG TPA: hypothetical protein VEA99_02640, partial [Gemmatimonadaceae bacterium]|nr:hypothetical protein [Gemmatimonadaceae bacterium]